MFGTIRMRKAWPRILLALNAIGAAFYVAAASRSWAIPAERAAGIYSVTGEPFVWFAGVFPIVLVATLLNLAWAGLTITRRDWRSGRTSLFAAAIWLAAIAIDFAHH